MDSPGRPPGTGSTHKGCVRTPERTILGSLDTTHATGVCPVRGPVLAHTSQPWVASLSALVPLLAQEVLELLHELLRVEVSVTLRARCLVPCCIIGLL
jgi:hypothetical protein